MAVMAAGMTVCVAIVAVVATGGVIAALGGIVVVGAVGVVVTAVHAAGALHVAATALHAVVAVVRASELLVHATGMTVHPASAAAGGSHVPADVWDANFKVSTAAVCYLRTVWCDETCEVAIRNYIEKTCIDRGNTDTIEK